MISLSWPKPKIIVIVGPTASGKSALAIKLAKKIGGEIVSADSRQVYRGLDIGTGKISKSERGGIPHHLLDVANPRHVFTVADFVRQAKKIIGQINARGHVPIIVGGTGFYIDSLLGNFSLPAVPPDKKLRARLEKLAPADLFALLKGLDPRRAQTIDRFNSRRLIRAIEIAAVLNRVPKIKKGDCYDVLWLGLNPPWPKLKQNIQARLMKRLRRGLIAEVKKIRRSGLSWSRLYDLGLEYRWVSFYLRKKITKEELLEGLEKKIQDYAKRQITWWRKNKNIIWRQPNQAPVQDRSLMEKVENFLKGLSSDCQWPGHRR